MPAMSVVNLMACMKKWNETYDVHWRVPIRTFICKARHAIVKEAVNLGADYILWVDDDAIVDPSFLDRLVAHDKDIVITPYYLRDAPYMCGILRSVTGDFNDQESYRNLSDSDLHQGLIEVDGGGTHCMLTKMSIYGPPKMEGESLRAYTERCPGQIPFPYFVLAPAGGTEDMYMCYMARNVGIRIYCDSDIYSPHVGHKEIITQEHHKQWHKKFGDSTLASLVHQRLKEDGQESKLPAWKYIGACDAVKSEAISTSDDIEAANAAPENSKEPETSAGGNGQSLQ